MLTTLVVSEGRGCVRHCLQTVCKAGTVCIDTMAKENLNLIVILELINIGVLNLINFFDNPAVNTGCFE